MIDTLKMFPDIYEMIEFVAKLIIGEISPNVDDWAFIAQIDKYEKYGIMEFFEKVKGEKYANLNRHTLQGCCNRQLY